MLPALRTRNFWPLYHRDPWHSLGRLFDEFWPRDIAPQNYGSIDVYEDEEHIFVEVELPGVERDQIDLTLEDGLLSLQAERTEENESKNKNYYVRERSRGQWTRSVRLPSPVNEETVDASFKDGILKVTLEKQRQAKGHKIKVN